MSVNPELRRNLWLEATPARLALIPGILAGVLFLAYESDGRRLGSGTAIAALVCLGILTWGWGAHLASESVLVELRGRTWDWQRMSGLGGWSLTWGKLAGATSPAWYGGAFCLLAYAAATPGDGASKGWMAALVVLVGILAQAGAFFSALQIAARGRVATRAQSSVYLVAAAVVLIQAFTGLVSSSARVDWWGLAPRPLELATLSAGAFAGFAVIGAWVRVRRELRIRTLSVAWPAFLLFVMLWFAGFASAERLEGGGRALVAFAVAVAAAWGTALLEPKDPVALRRVVVAARAGRWRTLAEDLPSWFLALPFVLGAWLAVAAGPATLGASDASVHPWAAAVVLFLLRDLCVVLFLSLGRRPRRADLLAVVLFAAGYVLVPLVLSASGLRAAAALGFPDPERGVVSAAGALVQAAIAAVLLAGRWRASARAVGAGGSAGAR